MNAMKTDAVARLVEALAQLADMVTPDVATRAIAKGSRWCYVVTGTVRDENGFIPSMIVENIAGHFPMLGNGEHASPWYWGETLDKAVHTCERANERRGISADDAHEIVMSSIAAAELLKARIARGRIS